MMFEQSRASWKSPLALQVSSIDNSHTVDLQKVNLSLRVLYRPKPDKIHEVYRNLGTDYDGRVLPSVINEVMKSVVAKYNA